MATPLPVFLVQLTASIAVIDPVAVRITNKYGDRVVTDAIKNAPRITGSLRRSIKRQKGKLGGGVASVSITAGGPSSPHDVDYAQYVELGAQGRAPNPFMRKAVNKNLPKFQKELADVMALLAAGRPKRVAGSIGR